MLRALLVQRVRGQALSELQVAIAVGAVVLAGFLFLFSRHVAASSAVNTYAANEAAVISLFKEAEDAGAAAQAVFSPSLDVGGNSNSDYHAMDVYQQDAVTHAGHFFEYCFKASTGECQTSQAVGALQRYTYTWSQLPQNGGTGATAQSSPTTVFSGFTFRVLTTAAQYADSTLDPYAYAYFQKYSPNFGSAKQFHWGYPGVTTSTNDLYVITVTLSNGEKRSVAFGKHHIAFSQMLLYGTATPTPNVMCASSCPTTSTSMSFQNPIAPSQSTTLYESNYGTRSTSPAQVYTASGCSGDATVSPSGTITPATDGTGAATITVKPVVQKAPSALSCTVSVTDNANQTVPVSVTIGQTYTPTASGGGVVAAGANASVTVSERNYAGPSASGGFTVATTAGTCTAALSSSSTSTDGTSTYSEVYTITFQQGGVVCAVTFTDVYGQSTSVNTQQQAAPQVWPPAIRFASSGTGTLASAQRAPWNVATTLNALLGGGIALAAGACSAEAFNVDSSGNLTTQLTAGATPPPSWYSGSSQTPPSVDANGCYNSAAYVVYENATTAFTVDNFASTCTSFVSAGVWSPSNAGPLATEPFTANSSTTSGTQGCIVQFDDSSNATVQSRAQVIDPCWAIGGSCTYTMDYLSGSGADCDPSTGATSSGYTGSGISTISPTTAGTWTTSDGGSSYVFTRSATGTVTVTEKSQYKSAHATLGKSGGYTCSFSTSYSTTGSFTIPSV